MIEEIKKEYIERMKSELGSETFDKYLNCLNLSTTHGMTINFNKLKESSVDLDYVINKFELRIMLIIHMIKKS